MVLTEQSRVERNGAEQAINACLLLVMLFFFVFITCRKKLCVSVDTLWHWKVDSCVYERIKVNTFALVHKHIVSVVVVVD